MDDAVGAAASRARARLEAGASVDDILQILDGELGRMRALLALQVVAGIGLTNARRLFEMSSLRSFAHLHLVDLERLSAIAGMVGDSWLKVHLERAVMDHRPWLLVVPGEEDGQIRFYLAKEATTDPQETGTSWERDLALSTLRDRVRACAAESEWQEYVEVVRDEPEALLIHFKL